MVAVVEGGHPPAAARSALMNRFRSSSHREEAERGRLRGVLQRARDRRDFYPVHDYTG